MDPFGFANGLFVRASVLLGLTALALLALRRTSAATRDIPKARRARKRAAIAPHASAAQPMALSTAAAADASAAALRTVAAGSITSSHRGRARVSSGRVSAPAIPVTATA